VPGSLTRGWRTGVGLEQQLPAAHGVAHRGVGRQVADQLQRDRRVQPGADVAVDHLLQLRAHRARIAGGRPLVDDQADRAPALRAGQHLDRRVGVGQRGGLGRRDDQHLVGE
jgi:hypothetical protein